MVKPHLTLPLREGTLSASKSCVMAPHLLLLLLLLLLDK
jgi:hypothetical protein